MMKKHQANVTCFSAAFTWMSMLQTRKHWLCSISEKINKFWRCSQPVIGLLLTPVQLIFGNITSSPMSEKHSHWLVRNSPLRYFTLLLLTVRNAHAALINIYL